MQARESRDELKKRVQNEYQEPFWDVVRGYAVHGYSQFAIAGLLETTQQRLANMQRDEGIAIQYPSRYASVYFKQARDECKITAEQLEKARIASAEHNRARAQLITYKGVTATIKEHAHNHGIPVETLRWRLKTGRPLDFVFSKVKHKKSAPKPMRIKFGKGLSKC